MSKYFTSVEFYKEHLDKERAKFERIAKFKDEVAPLIDEFIKSLKVKPKRIDIVATKYPKVVISYSPDRPVTVVFSQLKGAYKITAYYFATVNYRWTRVHEIISRDIKEFIKLYRERES